MKLLITGATGFVGSHLCHRRCSHGDDVTVVTRPRSDTSPLPDRVRTFPYSGDLHALNRLMETGCFTGIIHLATHFCVNHAEHDVDMLVDGNIRFGLQLFEAATKYGVPWIINTGTYTQHYKDREYSPVNLYAATKQAFEDIAAYYAEATPTTVVHLKLFDTFGAGDRRNKLVCALIESARTGKPIDLSPGEQFVDISPIQNVLDGYDRMIKLLGAHDHAFLRGKSFALPSSERMTLKSFIACFEKALGRKLPVTFGARPYREREMMIPWTRGVSVPGWKPAMTLEEGLRKLLETELC